MEETNTKQINLSMFACMKSVMETSDIYKGKHHVEFSIREVKKEDTSEVLWNVMNNKNFYAIHMYESFTGNSVDGYISKEEFDNRILSRIERSDK